MFSHYFRKAKISKVPVNIRQPGTNLFPRAESSPSDIPECTLEIGLPRIPDVEGQPFWLTRSEVFNEIQFNSGSALFLEKWFGNHYLFHIAYLRKIHINTII